MDKLIAIAAIAICLLLAIPIITFIGTMAYCFFSAL